MKGRAYPGMPRWVKIGGAILLALVLLFLIAKAFGVGGEHGPARHGAATWDAEGEASPIADGAHEIDPSLQRSAFEPRATQGAPRGGEPRG